MENLYQKKIILAPIQATYNFYTQFQLNEVIFSYHLHWSSTLGNINQVSSNISWKHLLKTTKSLDLDMELNQNIIKPHPSYRVSSRQYRPWNVYA